jgi:hypothetical protein
MEESEIKKKLAEMQSKLKPIEKGETTIKAEAPPAPKAAAPPLPKPTPIKKPTAKEKAAAGPPPFEIPVVVEEMEPEQAAPVTPCLTKSFKYLVDSLDPDYIGKNNGKDMLMEILGSIPTCPEGAVV